MPRPPRPETARYSEDDMTSTVESDARTAWWIRRLLTYTAVAILFLIGTIFAWKLISPQLNLYRAETEKQAVIAEQRAVSEAAEFAAKSEVIQAQAKADAEVIRAQGLADAQAIISETLNEPYLRYLYIQQLNEGEGTVIYVPTEAGLPILEAGRTPLDDAAPPPTEPDE